MDLLNRLISKVTRIFTQVPIAIICARFLYIIAVQGKRLYFYVFKQILRWWSHIILSKTDPWRISRSDLKTATTKRSDIATGRWSQALRTGWRCERSRRRTNSRTPATASPFKQVRAIAWNVSRRGKRKSRARRFRLNAYPWFSLVIISRSYLWLSLVKYKI